MGERNAVVRTYIHTLHRQRHAADLLHEVVVNTVHVPHVCLYRGKGGSNMGMPHVCIIQATCSYRKPTHIKAPYMQRVPQRMTPRPWSTQQSN